MSWKEVAESLIDFTDDVKTPNISEWLDFEFYDLVWWWDWPNKPNINDEMKWLGRWLGMSHHVGSDLCYWIVTDSGQVVSKMSVEHVTGEDYLSEDTKVKVKDFEKKPWEHLDDSNFILQVKIALIWKCLRILMMTALVQW